MHLFWICELKYKTQFNGFVTQKLINIEGIHTEEGFANLWFTLNSAFSVCSSHLSLHAPAEIEIYYIIHLYH